MDRKRNSEKPEPEEHPIEPEMEKRLDEERPDPPKEKRSDEL